MSRPVVALALAGALGWSTMAGATPTEAGPGSRQGSRPGSEAHGLPTLPVVGYAIEGVPASVVRREAHALAVVGVDGVTVHADGRQVGLPSDGARRLLRTAHRNGLEAALLLSNFSAARGDFSTPTAGRLLTSRANSARVADRMAHVVRTQGWDGVTVDLEALRASHAQGLVRFTRLLDARLPAETVVDLDVSASTHYRRHGYDVPALLAHVDRIVVMAYDQHGPTWSGPGPVGALPWQRSSLEALIELAPADRIDLGVGGYGYTWPAAPRQHEGHSVSPRQARRLAADDGVTPQWRPRAGEWFALLDDGTRVWWSDARSWRKRVRLALDLGVHGLALWRLGSADPLP